MRDQNLRAEKSPQEQNREPKSLPEEWAEAAGERVSFFSEFESRLDSIRKRNPARHQEVGGMNTVLLGMKAMGEP
ncbi:MAG: hypothetical protein ACP5QG_05395 [candidate division WOR-3 bacterium]